MLRVCFTHLERSRGNRGPLIASSLLLALGGALSLFGRAPGDPTVRVYDAFLGGPLTQRVSVTVPSTEQGTGKGSSRISAESAPIAAPAPAGPDISAYRGLGAWVDQFDFGRGWSQPPALVVDELARRGVKTLYLQTGKWNSPDDFIDPTVAQTYLQLAHAQGIKVVGWYLPGFVDVPTDVARSMAVLNFRSATGDSFDGFAPDIEERRAAGGRDRFNAGVAEYSRQLRSAAGPGIALGAITVDAKNNKRAPNTWEGFPWPQIGQYYDVIMPMAYWSVTKRQAECGNSNDVAAYMREMRSETRALMGVDRPFHAIGGIADCITPAEVDAFVGVSKELGFIGGSLYDFQTTQANPQADSFWALLGRFNAPS